MTLISSRDETCRSPKNVQSLDEWMAMVTHLDNPNGNVVGRESHVSIPGTSLFGLLPSMAMVEVLRNLN